MQASSKPAEERQRVKIYGLCFVYLHFLNVRPGHHSSRPSQMRPNSVGVGAQTFPLLFHIVRIQPIWMRVCMGDQFMSHFMHSKSYNRLQGIDVNYMLACEMYTFLLLSSCCFHRGSVLHNIRLVWMCLKLNLSELYPASFGRRRRRSWSNNKQLKSLSHCIWHDIIISFGFCGKSLSIQNACEWMWV